MIDVKLKYQASLFANLEHISPRSENISTLLELFQDKELIPNVFQEIGGSTAGIAPRIAMNSVDGEWVIQFASKRINIEKNPTASSMKGENLGSLEKFCSDSTDFFTRILSKFKIKPNRLALITNYMLEEMTPDVLNEIYRKFFNPTPFYTEHEPFEWNWRAGAKSNFTVANLEERINALTTVSRARGDITSQDGLTSFDRIQILLDLNTEAENKEDRFEANHIRAFYQDIIQVHDRMLKDIEDFVNE